LKTYDPESGVVLKFKTDRAAEVGRLIGSLGRMGRHMAALPPKSESKLLHALRCSTFADSIQHKIHLRRMPLYWTRQWMQ
jgi:hypothetical protein